MKSVLTVGLLLVVSFLFSQEKIKKTVFIIVDGISDDVLKEINTPHLDEIAEVGAFLPAYVGGEAGGYSETPTISAVGYNSLLTGVWANKHNVWGNGIEVPNYHYWTVFRYFKEQYPSKTTAIYSTWLDNRTKLIGEKKEATGNLIMDYHFDDFENDTIHFPHDEATTYIRDIDNLVADEAARHIKEKSPDLSWVYLQFTDNMGHGFGDHPRFYESIRTMDDQVGRIWSAVKYREENFNEEWMIVITTDHGRDEETGKHHGGQSERERSTWIVVNKSNINQYGIENRVPVVDILPTIANYMDIRIPKTHKMELDGIPFIGETEAHHLMADKKGNQIDVRWESTVTSGDARVWLSITDRFGTGGRDQYLLVKELDISDEKAVIDVSEVPSPFYKIVLETPNHYLNRWVIDE